jgi:hypothetical protein
MVVRLKNSHYELGSLLFGLSNAQSDQVVAALRWPSEIDHNIVTVGAGTLGYGCEITDPAGLPAVAMMTG